MSAHREQRGGTEVARREEEDARGAARREDEQRPEDVVEGEEGAQAEQDDEDAAPGPALEPDDPSSRSQGFIVCPPNQMSFNASAPRLNLATSTAPASRRRFTTTASSLGTRFLKGSAP